MYERFEPSDRVFVDREEHLDWMVEALEIRRELAQKFPDLFLHRVATTLNNLGVFLAETYKSSEAEEAFGEALQLRRELVEKAPDLYQPGVLSTLNNLAVLFKQTGKTSESQRVFREAIDIGEELVVKAPTLYQQKLVTTLCNHALLLSDIGGTDNPLQDIKTRLKELGIKSLPKNEEWSEEEEEEANIPGAV